MALVKKITLECCVINQWDQFFVPLGKIVKQDQEEDSILQCNFKYC